jgi:hypothetical protein
MADIKVGSPSRAADYRDQASQLRALAASGEDWLDQKLLNFAKQYDALAALTEIVKERNAAQPTMSAVIH